MKKKNLFCYFFFLFFFSVTSRPPEQHSIWETIPKCCDTISYCPLASTVAVLRKDGTWYLTNDALMQRITFSSPVPLTLSFIPLRRKQFCLGDAEVMQQDSVRVIFSSREFNPYYMGWMDGKKEGRSFGAQMFGACKLKTCVWQCSDSVLLPGTNEDYIKIHTVYKGELTLTVPHLVPHLCECVCLSVPP